MPDDPRMPRNLRKRLEREPGLEPELEAEIIAGQGRTLCPMCAARPQTKRTGLCDVCHYRTLAAQVRDHDATVEAKRAYYRAKADARRTVVCRECGETYAPRLDSEGRVSDRSLCPECREGDDSRDTPLTME